MEITEEQLRIEKMAERILNEIKDQGGSINLKSRLVDVFNNESLAIARVSRLLIAHGLTTIPYLENPDHHRLTKAGWYFKSFQGERDEVLELKRLQKEQLESVINTNRSIENLNERTRTFYEKQEKLGNIQKYLAWSIAVSTALYTIFTILSFWKGCK